MARYATATEFRNVTNIQAAEFSDTKLEQLLDFATAWVDLKTGRTWQGSQTVTNELYDGNGEDYIYLNQVDVSSVTALSIDEDYDGNFVSVDTDDLVVYDKIGKVVLDSVRNSDITVSKFTEGAQTVKVSYTWGEDSPTDDVVELCINVALNEIHSTPELVNSIMEKVSLLRANSIDIG